MFKVLIVGKYYHPFSGGIETVTKVFAEYLARNNEVTVIANAHDDKYGKETINGVRVNRLKTDFTMSSQPVSLSLFSNLNLNDYNVIHFHAPNPYAAVCLSVRLMFSKFSGALLITHHMEIFGRAALKAMFAPFYKYLVRRAKFVMVSSRKNIRKDGDLPVDANICVLPFCLDPEDYDFSDEARSRALKWREESYGKSPLIGFVGRHARYKGLDVLVRSLVTLPETQLVLGGDGPFRAEIETLANSLGVADRVHFLGRLNHEEKSRLLMAIDVFAFPSTEITEAFGITQLEAMLAGAVVVASDLPTGVTDVALDGVTALTAKVGDAEDLADQIRRVLRDQPLAAKLRGAALDRFFQKFSKDAVENEFQLVLNRLEQY